MERFNTYPSAEKTNAKKPKNSSKPNEVWEACAKTFEFGSSLWPENAEEESRTLIEK